MVEVGKWEWREIGFNLQYHTRSISNLSFQGNPFGVREPQAAETDARAGRKGRGTDGQAWLFRDGWIAVAHPEPYRGIGAGPMASGYEEPPSRSPLWR